MRTSQPPVSTPRPASPCCATSSTGLPTRQAKDLVQRISQDQGEVAGAFAADLLTEPRRLSI